MSAKKLKISFDLDNTLFVPEDGGTHSDGLTWPGGGGKYHLRPGTAELMQTLIERGWEIWIYTNSYRGHVKVLRWFQEKGIEIAGVINQMLHEEECRKIRLLPSQLAKKIPSHFGFILHVDDELDICGPGPRHGFGLIHITPDDQDWTSKVLAAADQKQNSSDSTEP